MLRRKAPPILGIKAWINTEPFKIEDLEGKVVIVDFWTYSCVNCLRTLPKMKILYETYKDKGLVIIGVHTPEFGFEGEVDNVESACKRLGITWPVALDAQQETFNAYQNHYWPHHFLIDKEGYVVWDHIGEGGVGLMEEELKKLLGIKSDNLVPVESKEPGIALTPETYCGLKKNHGLGSSKVCNLSGCEEYVMPTVHSPGVLYPEGAWIQTDECLEVIESGSTLMIQYTAGEVNIVLSGNGYCEVLLDGKPVPVDKRGKNIIEKDGKTFIVLDHPDMYSVISGNVGTHELTIDVPHPCRVYAYTFG